MLKGSSINRIFTLVIQVLLSLLLNMMKRLANSGKHSSEINTNTILILSYHMKDRTLHILHLKTRHHLILPAFYNVCVHFKAMRRNI